MIHFSRSIFLGLYWKVYELSCLIVFLFRQNIILHRWLKLQSTPMGAYSVIFDLQSNLPSSLMITFSLLPPLLIDLTLRLSIWRRHPPTAPSSHLCRVVQKNSCMFEFPAFLLPTNLGQLTHCQSSLREHVSFNFKGAFLLDPLGISIHGCQENALSK